VERREPPGAPPTAVCLDVLMCALGTTLLTPCPHLKLHRVAGRVQQFAIRSSHTAEGPSHFRNQAVRLATNSRVMLLCARQVLLSMVRRTAALLRSLASELAPGANPRPGLADGLLRQLRGEPAAGLF
jgi:hypothetical protein